MTTLAPKLPYSHPFAGGYPRLGGQPLPTDPDAIDYLNRVAAADGAAVEVGVAMAVDAFVKGCKADSAGYAGDPTRTVWDAIKSSCIMCGARTLAGALVSLKSYSDELVDIDNLPTPTIQNAAASSGSYNASTRTLSGTTSSTGAYPRAIFPLVVEANKTYKISGRVSGDTTLAYGVQVGAASYILINQSTGEFSGTVSSGAGTNFILAAGNISVPSQPFSITIEELSIREYFASPTNVANNFTASDYNRTTGLKGDGSTTYLDSGRANNADGQNDNHNAVFLSSTGNTVAARIIGGNSAIYGVGDNVIGYSSGDVFVRSRSQTGVAGIDSASVGLLAHSRSISSSVVVRSGNTDYSVSQSSQTPSSTSITIFAGAADGSSSPTDARLAFYSIGSSLDLAALDARVTTLVKGIQFWHYTGLSPHAYDPDTISYVVAGYAAGGTL